MTLLTSRAMENEMSDETIYRPGPHGGMIGILPGSAAGEQVARVGKVGISGDELSRMVGAFGNYTAAPMSVLTQLKRQRDGEVLALSRYRELVDRHQQNLDDLDRAIAALDPAPSAPDHMPIESVRGEESSRDHLAEFMQREGATLWKLGVTPQPAATDTTECIFENDDVGILMGAEWDEIADDDRGTIRAFRIISQPAEYADPTAVAIAAYIDGETYTDGVRNDSQQEEGAGERADPQTDSILDSPELDETVKRLKATLAADEPTERKAGLEFNPIFRPFSRKMQGAE